MRRSIPWFPLSAAAVLVACVAKSGAPPRPPTPEQEIATSRAALVVLAVENRTEHSLLIAYLIPSPPRTEIRVGSVGAGQTARLAPVPADEPIQLIARRPDGAELRLPTRSLGRNGEFVWSIGHDAEFRPAGSEEP